MPPIGPPGEMLTAGYRPELRLVWMALAGLAFAIYLVAPLATAALCSVGPRFAGRERIAPALPPRVGRVLAGLAYAALFAALLGAAAAWVRPRFTLDLEQETYFTIAYRCVAGLKCPMAGQPMNAFQVKLGPLFYQMLVVIERFDPDPIVFFRLMVLFWAAAITLLAALGNRLLGWPWGLLAGAWMGAAPKLLNALYVPTHANLTLLPLAGFAWGLIAWLRTGRGGAFVGMATCLLLAIELHGIPLAFVPAVVLAAALARRWPAAWALLVVAGLAALLYAPWLHYNLATHFADVPLMGLPPAINPQALILERIDPRAAPLAALGLAALALAALRPGASREDRATALALGGMLLAAVGALVAWYDRWETRYTIAFYPALPLVSAIGARALWQLVGADPRGGGRARVRAAVAGALVVLLVEETWPTPPPFEKKVPYDDQRAVAAMLRPLGFDAHELDRRVHGTIWRGRDLAPVYLGAMSLPGGPAAPPPDRRQVLLVEDCAAVPAPFATWQRAAWFGGHTTALAEYQPELSPPVAELRAGGTVLWTGPMRLPWMRYDGGGWERLLSVTLDATSRSSTERRSFEVARRSLGWDRLVIRTTLAAGGGDRVLVLSSGAYFSTELRIGGEAAVPLPAEPLSEDVAGRLEKMALRRYRVTAEQRRAGPVEVEVVATVVEPGSCFDEIDLFEEPWPRCAVAP